MSQMTLCALDGFKYQGGNIQIWCHDITWGSCCLCWALSHKIWLALMWGLLHQNPLVFRTSHMRPPHRSTAYLVPPFQDNFWKPRFWSWSWISGIFAFLPYALWPDAPHPLCFNPLSRFVSPLLTFDRRIVSLSSCAVFRSPSQEFLNLGVPGKMTNHV